MCMLLPLCSMRADGPLAGVRQHTLSGSNKRMRKLADASNSSLTLWDARGFFFEPRLGQRH